MSSWVKRSPLIEDFGHLLLTHKSYDFEHNNTDVRQCNKLSLSLNQPRTPESRMTNNCHSKVVDATL